MVTKRMSDSERLEHYRSILRSQEESGLTIAQWCKENQISKNTFHRYKRAVLDENRTVETSAASSKEARIADTTDKRKACKDGIIVVEAGGITVWIGAEADPEAAVSVIRALHMSC